MAVKGASGNLVISIDDFIKSNTRDDAIRDGWLKTPDGVIRFDDIPYGEDERNLLDVYRPREKAGALPVIVSVHGGGWVYGSKELMQHYCMSLAERGFAVVNFNYRLAPKHKHPAPIEDTDKVFRFVLKRAEEFGFDTDNIFAVGDSVGANIVAYYSCLCADPAQATAAGIFPPEGFIPKALGLNCGLYRMARGENDPLMDNLAAEYFPNGGSEEEYADVTLAPRVNSAFPPCFIMTALGDFLKEQAKPFCERLKSLGVQAEYHLYGEAGNELKHVFHVDLRLPEAHEANGDECDFFHRIAAESKGN